jgi:prenylcysteine oxidase/farnesylcysteine lyase
VHAWNLSKPDSEAIIELGASIFVEINHILLNATRRYNLSTTDFAAPVTAGPLLGIFNGESFIFTQNAGTWGYWDIAKLIWRYGLSPIRTQNLMKSTVGRFLEMYDSPSFPFASLTHEVYNKGLKDVVAATGEEFLKANGIGDAFAKEVVQAR